MAVYYSIIRRASSSLTPLAARVASSRSFISAAAPVTNNLFNQKLIAVPSPFHYLSSLAATKLSSDDTLLQIIDSEINSGVRNQNQDSVEFLIISLHLDSMLKIPPGFPFAIEDEPGERTVTLTRRNKNEVIKVLVDIPNPKTDAVDDSESACTKIAGFSIPLVVSVSKQNGLCLEFGVTAFPDDISIDSVSIKASDINSEDQTAYQGPDLSDLKGNLRNALHTYLENRGIKPSTTNVILEYMIDKDRKEYFRWLRNLKCFIKD